MGTNKLFLIIGQESVQAGAFNRALEGKAYRGMRGYDRLVEVEFRRDT